MPELEVPIAKGVYKSVDGVVLRDDNADLIDGYLGDIEGETVARPMLLSVMEFGGSGHIDGLYWWDVKNALIVVNGGRTFKLEKTGTVYTRTDLSNTLHTAGNRVSFATDGTYLFMASGGAILYTDGTTTTAAIADADAPTSVTHVAWVDGYLLANANSNTFYWSDLNASLTWTATNFATATRSPDFIKALFVRKREIILFGPESIEIWENDGVTPFSNIPGGTFRIGTNARYSVVNAEDTLYFMSSMRRFYKQEGANPPERISTPYDKELEGYSTVTDCLGDYIEDNGIPLLIFHFPTAGKTLVHKLSDGTWSQWGAWNSDTVVYDRWKGNVAVFVPGWGQTIVGSHATETVYRHTQDHTQYDASDSVRLFRRTGHVDYGTDKFKRSNRLTFRAKRGDNQQGSPLLSFRYRNDNRPTWSNEHLLSLGNAGVSDIPLRVHRTGMFRARQYEFVVSDNVSKIFLTAREDLEIMTR